VNFWANWCAPCRGEAPDLQALAERTGGQGLVVLGVNQQEDLATVNKFMGDFSITYPIVMDRDGDVSVAYRVGSGLPISMLVDPDGVIVRIIIGALTDEDISSLEAEATT
jgi:thiol-disulfide isomerase/thioredoxin